MRILELPVNNEEISNALDFISNSLQEFDVKDKGLIQNSMLVTEECLVSLIKHSSADETMEISVKKSLSGKVFVSLEVPGTPFAFYMDIGCDDPVEIDDADQPDIENDIRGFVMSKFENEVTYENKQGVNIVKILLEKED